MVDVIGVLLNWRGNWEDPVKKKLRILYIIYYIFMYGIFFKSNDIFFFSRATFCVSLKLSDQIIS